MNRVVVIGVLVASLALPAVAQRGGMGGGMRAGGMRAGGMRSGVAAGHFGGTRIFIGNTPFPTGRIPFFPPGVFVGNRFGFGFGPRFDRFGHRFGHNRGFVGWGGWGSWGGWGWPGGWDSSSYYDPQQQMAQGTMAEQERIIGDLEDQLRHERLQRMEAEHDTDVSENTRSQAPSPAARRPVTPEAAAKPTVLVFRDQRRLEVANYAIVGNTLYDISPPLTKKIQISDLDVPATVQANQARGVDFSVPETLHVTMRP